MPKNWTIEQRNEAARRARLKRPWEYSTGPRTCAGKRTSSRNAYKHGYYSFEKTVLRWYVRLCALRLAQVKTLETMWRKKLREFHETRNELSLKHYKWNRNPLRFPHKVFKNGDIFTTHRR